MGNLDVMLARWESILGQFYSQLPLRNEPPGLDCSGGINYADRTVVPWLAPLGTSASMAQYAVRNGLVKPLAQRKPGDLVIYDRYGVAVASYGNRGHVGQVSEDVNVTWECAGSHGVRRYDYYRLRWCMCIDMRRWFSGGAAPVLPPPDWSAIAALLEGDDDVSDGGSVVFGGVMHDFYLQPDKKLLHVWPGPHKEYMDGVAAGVPVPLIRTILGIKVMGPGLYVRYVGEDSKLYSLGYTNSWVNTALS